MRKTTLFLVASAALLSSACGHQQSASQQTAQATQGPATESASVQLASATVQPVPGQDFYPGSDYHPEPEGGSAAAADDSASFHDQSMAASRANADQPRRYARDSLECFVLRQQYNRAVQEGTLHTNSAEEVATAEACFSTN